VFTRVEEVESFAVENHFWVIQYTSGSFRAVPACWGYTYGRHTFEGAKRVGGASAADAAQSIAGREAFVRKEDQNLARNTHTVIVRMKG
jgi:hypothetical protein